MKRKVLQIPIKAELRKKAESKAGDLGFSSLQEMVRVMLTQMTRDENQVELDIGGLCDKYVKPYVLKDLKTLYEKK